MRDFPWLCCFWIFFLVASNVTVWGKRGPAPHYETERMTAIPCHCSWSPGLANHVLGAGTLMLKEWSKDTRRDYPQWRQRSIREPVVTIQACGAQTPGTESKQTGPLRRLWQGSQLPVPFFVLTRFLSLVPQYSYYFYGYLLSFQCMVFAS